MNRNAKLHIKCEWWAFESVVSLQKFVIKNAPYFEIYLLWLNDNVFMLMLMILMLSIYFAFHLYHEFGESIWLLFDDDDNRQNSEIIEKKTFLVLVRLML